MAGYSRLMAGDERATVQSLDAARALFRKRIEANQGRVIDMAGDSVLAVFETAAGAVLAALDVQQEIESWLGNVAEDRRMRFRIGVHLGDVIEKGDGSIYGDGVNIAARLEGLALPGGITVSDAVECAVRNKVVRAFRRSRRAGGEEHRPPGARVPCAGGGTREGPAGVGGRRRAFLRQAVDHRAAVPNMSGVPEQDYFADGLTEDILTDLSRFRELFVISRNTSFKYKGQAVDVKKVAHDLGVRYVVEGSVRKAGNRVRITVQLIDAESDHHVWAERYDRDLEDIFAIQDEVTSAIVATLPGRLEADARSRAERKPPANMAAYECVLEAKVLHHRSNRDDE